MSTVCQFLYVLCPQAFFGHSHFYSCMGHADEGRTRDPVDYKLAVDNLGRD